VGGGRGVGGGGGGGGGAKKQNEGHQNPTFFILLFEKWGGGGGGGGLPVFLFKFPFFSYGFHRQPFYGSTAYFMALDMSIALNFMPCGKSCDFGSACHLLTLL